jgi:phosphatidylglycerophosphatase A
VLFALGVWCCDACAKNLGVHDHPGIVWDEVVGYLITMIAVPKTLLWVVVGFILFRFFDILKPWPISWIDKHVEGGMGIMLDDVLAAVFALIVIQIALYFI